MLCDNAKCNCLSLPRPNRRSGYDFILQSVIREGHGLSVEKGGPRAGAVHTPCLISLQSPPSKFSGHPPRLHCGIFRKHFNYCRRKVYCADNLLLPLLPDCRNIRSHLEPPPPQNLVKVNVLQATLILKTDIFLTCVSSQYRNQKSYLDTGEFFFGDSLKF